MNETIVKTYGVTRVYMGAEWAHWWTCQDEINKALTNAGVQGWTAWPTTGGWEGKMEDGVVVELVHESDLLQRGDFVSTLLALAKRHGEKTLLITDQPVSAELMETGA